MVYFPTDVFSNILSYCDDTIERKQRKIKDETLDELMGLVIDAYIYGSNFDEYSQLLGLYSFEDYLIKQYGTSNTFKITMNNDIYELGCIWLVRCFHGDTIDLDYQGWVYYEEHLYY